MAETGAAPVWLCAESVGLGLVGLLGLPVQIPSGYVNTRGLTCLFSQGDSVGPAGERPAQEQNRMEHIPERDHREMEMVPRKGARDSEHLCIHLGLEGPPLLLSLRGLPCVSQGRPSLG